MKRNNKTYQPKTKALRNHVQRTNQPCWLCGQPINTALHWKHPQSFTADHTTPITTNDAAQFPLAPHSNDAVAKSELRTWLQSWGAPQAVAWIREPFRWPVIAEYCRLKAVLESAVTVNAAGIAQLHRYRDQLGLSPAGLSENG